ncbi:MAB_1171c family putative transporter [Nocardia wallacei]|uniref:MAB_1171c family putative transporter n=1 Tax=Nocardia wallacei TaxID=480035 RepID=UPI00245511D0|nr:MAB_1171c family putative transporter [Nocardia wallacei]
MSVDSIELALRWAKAVLLILIAVWEVGQLVTHRDNVQLRALTPGLVLLAVIATIGIDTPARDSIRDFFGIAWSPFVNGCWMSMACAYAVFFVLVNPHQARPTPAQIRQARREIGLLILAISIQTLVTVTAPPGTWHHPAQLEDYTTWQNIVLVTSIDGYALAIFLLGGVRAWRYRSHVTYPWMRAAILLVIVGTALMAIGVDGISLLKVVAVAVVGYKPAFFSVVYSVGQLGGQIAVAVGLALIPLAGVVVSVLRRADLARQRRYARKLAPLWQTLTAAVPYIRLTHDAPNRTCYATFGNVTSEISDALAELSRYAPPASGDARDPEVAAAMIAAALRSVRDPAAADTLAPPYPRIEPDVGDWRQRARWMLMVDRELSKLDTASPQEGVQSDVPTS